MAELTADSSPEVAAASYNNILHDAQTVLAHSKAKDDTASINKLLASMSHPVKASIPSVSSTPAIHQQRHQRIRTTITSQNQASATYNSKTFYKGPARRVTWWYAANNAQELPAAVNAVTSHAASFWGVMLYCGYTIGVDGNLTVDSTTQWYCDGPDGAIAKFRAAGVDIEIVVSDTQNFAVAFANPEPITDALVALTNKYNLYGINLDIEPPLAATTTAEDYASFCSPLRKRLNAYNTRLTIDVGDFHNMLNKYPILSRSVDRIIDMSTYRANDYKQWLNTYRSIVNSQVPLLRKVGIGFAVFNYNISTLNPKWISDPDGAKLRIKQASLDGVPEINFFRLSPASQMPLSFWYEIAATFSTKLVEGQTPNRLTPTEQNPLGAPKVTNRVNVGKKGAVAGKSKNPKKCSSSTGAAPPKPAASTGAAAPISSTGVAARTKLKSLTKRTKRIKVASCKDCHVNPVPYDWEEAKRLRARFDKKVTPIYDRPAPLSGSERMELYNKYRSFRIGAQAFYPGKKLRGEAKKLSASVKVNHDAVNDILDRNPEIDRLVNPEKYM